MNKSILCCILIINIVLFLACSKEGSPTDSNEYFIYGTSFGFCIGNCTHLFKLENGEVFPDVVDRLNVDELVFSVEADNDQLDVALRLHDAFPNILLDSDQDRYGCPDCADQGTIFIQRKIGDEVRSWFIDTRESKDWSDELKEYHSILKSNLGEI